MHHRIFFLHFSTVSMSCRTQYCVVSQDDCLLLVLEYDCRGHGHLEPYRVPLVLDQLAPRPYRGRERRYSRKQPVRGHCVGSIATSLYKNVFTYPNIFQHNQMETFFVLLALCTGNSPITGEFPVTGEFPSQRPVTRCFDVFFDLRLNKRLSKQSRRRRFETPSHLLWRHCNVTHVMTLHVLHYSDVIISVTVSQIAGVSIVFLTYSRCWCMDTACQRRWCWRSLAGIVQSQPQKA